jgi:hypothetical protein
MTWLLPAFLCLLPALRRGRRHSGASENISAERGEHAANALGEISHPAADDIIRANEPCVQESKK